MACTRCASAITWVLFGLMVSTVPVFYYMFVIGGFIPLSAIIAMSFRGVWGFALFNAVHVVMYGALFYWIASIISRRLAALPRPWRIVTFSGISAALVAMAFLPLYDLGHHESQSVNLYRLFLLLFGRGK